MKRNLKSGQGIAYSIFNGDKLTQNDVQGIKNYANALKNGLKPSEAFKNNMLNCSVAAKQYVVNAKKAGKSAEELTAGLQATSVSAKAGQVALKGLAIAGHMIAIWAISKGIELYKW